MRTTSINSLPLELGAPKLDSSGINTGIFCTIGLVTSGNLICEYEAVKIPSSKAIVRKSVL